jgi:aryl-alcohol dehydrogenase-like predicted oxidoreductase
MLRSPSGAFLGSDGRPNSVKNFASYSLQRLGVDVIDLHQPARPDPSVPYEETIGAIADLIKEGKVRYLGVSEVGANHVRRAHSAHPVTALEIEYSLACRFIEPEILPTARELGIAIVPYRVLADGLLTGLGKNFISPVIASMTGRPQRTQSWDKQACQQRWRCWWPHTSTNRCSFSTGG